MGSFVRKCLRKAAIVWYRVINILLPVKQKRIVFSSSIGKSYSGNPRYIYEFVVKQRFDEVWECIWFYEKEPFDIPGHVRQVKYRSLAYLRYMATARLWVFDGRQPAFLRRRPGTWYIQTWHGTPLKKLGLDLDAVFMSGGLSLETYKKNFSDNAHTWDFLISQNPFSTETFRRCFDFRGKMLEYGYPRNDILFRKNTPDFINQKRRELGVPDGKRVLLYAPTWRDDEFTGEQKYSFRPAMDFDRMMEALRDEWVMLVKYHYLIQDAIDWTPYEGFVLPFDQSGDIAELYLVSDALITDYSSVMFDYSILGRPMYFFAYDLDKYANTLRGFYFDYEEEMPGPIVKTTDDLITAITDHDPAVYDLRYQKFREKYNPFDDGRACTHIFSLMRKLVPTHANTLLNLTKDETWSDK